MEPRFLKMFASPSMFFLSMILVILSGIVLQWRLALDMLPLSSLMIWQGVEDDFVCAKPNYTTRVLLYDPFMMHIENFITADERAHLINLG